MGVEMTAVAAEARLKRMLAWESKPALDQTAIDDLLAIHSSLDDDDETVTLYDLPAAAAEGWTWKAAAAASEVNFSSDGQSISRAQYLAHCERMIERYAGSSSFSLSTSARDE